MCAHCASSLMRHTDNCCPASGEKPGRVQLGNLLPHVAPAFPFSTCFHLLTLTLKPKMCAHFLIYLNPPTNHIVLLDIFYSSQLF